MRDHPLSSSSYAGTSPRRFIARLFCIALMLMPIAPVSVSAQTTPPASVPPNADIPATPPVDPNKPSADASGGQLRDLEARPVLRLRGQSTWDDGFQSLKSAIDKLALESKRLGLAVINNPMAHFTDSDDLGFTYEVFQPLGAEPPANPAPAGSPAPAEGMELTRSPSGRVMVFAHEGAYDEIDSAYEAITAWLDEKGLSATGKFMEEYIFLPEKADEIGMKLNIYVFLK